MSGLAYCFRVHNRICARPAALVRGLLLGSLALMPLCAPAARAAADGEFSFRVWAGEREIGTHTFSVNHQGAMVNVLSKAVYKVKVLFVNVFSYNHIAREVWDGDCLTSLTSQTVENKEHTEISATRREQVFTVLRNDEPLLQTEECIGSYAYWDKQRIQRDALMNAQTGEINTVEVTDLGLQPVPRLTSLAHALQLDTDEYDIRLWYADDDTWLALLTERDGQEVLYLNEALLEQ